MTEATNTIVDCGFKEYKKDKKEIYMEVLRSNYE